MKYLYILLIIALTSCSANYHLRKAISKDPSILTQGVVIETVTDTIEVVVPELRVDTLHAWSVDTVTTYVDRVRIRTKVDTVQRTVYVDVVCPADTVYVEHTTERTVIRPEVKERFDWRWILIVVAIALFAWIIRDK